jgi:hypothetical protein
MIRVVSVRRRAAGILRTVVLVTLLSASAVAQTGAATITVGAGGNLQAAIDGAQPGDTIVLEAGATFVGNFTLPVKSGSTYITLRSSTPDQYLPAPGTRVTPAYASLLAKIKSPNTAPALKTRAGAHHWRLLFLELAPNAVDGRSEILQLGSGSPTSQYSASQLAYDIDIDRVYIHGDPARGQRRGISLNARSVTIRNSYISDIKSIADHSQAIAGWNGPGPYTIENNYLEASGENLLFGGEDPAIQNLVTADVVIRRNYFSKPMAWRSQSWGVYNLLELKNARRVLIEHNVFENNWAGGQPGYAIVFTPRNQDGGCSWCVVEDVTFQRNIVRNTGGGINISGYDDIHPSAQTNNIAIRQNLFYAVTKALGNGWFMLIGNAPRDIVVDHNTIDADGSTVLYGYGGTASDPREIYGLEFTNNAARHNSYGINAANYVFGTSAINAYFPGCIIQGNWLSGGVASRYPAGNLFAGAFADAFVSIGTRDYRPATGSILIGSATDATNIGADMTVLQSAVSGVIEGLPGATGTPAPPPPDEPPAEPTPTDPTPPTASGEIQLLAKAAILAGDWQLVADATAAGGARVWNPDRGSAKLTAAQSNPASYIDVPFTAQAGRAYRLWIRAVAERNSWANDSVFVQFSGSVTAAGAAVYRIGTTNAATVNLEDGANAGLSGWGWQDNGYGAGVLGPLVYFTEGPQKIRIQVREDGLSIDQIVLSPEKYLTSSPGALKNDTTILASAPQTSTSTSEIVLLGKDASRLAGKWSFLPDTAAAGGVAVGSPDAGAAKPSEASASPANCVEFTFQVEAGRKYRLWLRGRADRDSWANDSVFVQFSNTINAGAPAWRIGTTDSLFVNLEDAANAGLSGWGWQDNGYGASVLGPLVTFATSGTQTVRIQTREDGFRIDQVVLSSERFVLSAPGALKNDATILR